MTERAFVKYGYWQALEKATCGNWDKTKVGNDTDTATKTSKLAYVLSVLHISDSLNSA